MKKQTTSFTPRKGGVTKKPQPKNDSKAKDSEVTNDKANS